MKKLFAIGALAFLITLSALPLTTIAAQLCPGGTDAECDPIIGVQFWCDKSVTPYTCVDTDKPTNTNPPQVAPTAPATTNPALAPATSVSSGSGSFKALAPIPGLTQGVDTSNLSNFLNNLYKFCIGAAAVIAVVVITMGGLQVMSGDSITAHSEGRDRIVGAILGLILVLAPFVVFSVINPKILNFGAFSDDLKSLQPSNTQTPPQTSGNGNINTGSGDETGNSTAGQAPNAPTNLTSSATTDTTAALSWNATTSSVPTVAYDVYDGTTLAQSVTGTTATVTGLTTGSTHAFTVKARAASGASSPASNQVEVVIATPGPTVPEGSLGSYTYGVWSYQGNTALYNHDPVPPAQDCWKWSTIPFPNPSYQTTPPHTAIDVATLCTQRLQDAQANNAPANGKPAVYYSCQKLGPNQQMTQPGAPGKICGGVSAQ